MKKLLFVGICALILSACNSNKDNSKEQSLGDSTAADTATTATTTSDYDAALALLDDIAVDRGTFKQIYQNCRAKGDEFSSSKFLYDKTSPITPNITGVFAYLNETSPGLRLAIQYNTGGGEQVTQAAFIIDGQVMAYPSQFKTDGGGQNTWQWSDKPVTNSQLPLLMKLATGKQVSLQLTSAQGKQTIPLTAQQQQAIKNMLMLYKGVLMGYNA